MEAIGQLILLAVQLYSFIVLGRVLMSWVNMDPESPLARTLYDLTEPVLRPVREMLPPAAGLDFSPIVVLIGLQIFGTMLAQVFLNA